MTYNFQVRTTENTLCLQQKIMIQIMTFKIPLSLSIYRIMNHYLRKIDPSVDNAFPLHMKVHNFDMNYRSPLLIWISKINVRIMQLCCGHIYKVPLWFNDMNLTY